MPSSKRFYTGVTLQTDVRQYLDQLARQLDRPRSYLINAIVREHMEKNDRQNNQSEANTTADIENAH